MNLTLVKPVYAAVPSVLTDPLGTKYRSLSAIFGLLINVVIGVGWALVFIFLALGFIKYILQRRNQINGPGQTVAYLCGIGRRGFILLNSNKVHHHQYTWIIEHVRTERNYRILGQLISR